MAPTKMKLRVRKKQGGTPKSSQQHRLRPEASPDSKCPICLDRFVNVASVERCLHRFCFRCIREWAKNKAECPLCKQPFRSIFHSVRAEDDFKEYVVFESAAENAAPSASASVPVPGAPIAAPERPDNPENAASRTARRSRAPRRGPAAQDSSGSSMDEGALQRLLPWLRRDRVADPFLLERTGHILHELVSFARSIEAMQCPPAPSYEEDSGSQSSVINISEDDDSEDANVTRNDAQERVPSVSMATGSEISLGQSTWDNETPGPSYSSLSQLQTDVLEPEGNPLGGTAGVTVERQEEEDEEECTIVGYVKPMAERTPELVQLSSDSTEEDEKAEMQLTVAKVEPPFPNQAQAPPSPKSYPSTSRVENQPQGCGFGNPQSSDSSGQSGRITKPDRPRPHREPRRRVSSSSSPSASPWEMPEPKKCREERRRRKKTRRRARDRKRSRSPHRRRDRALYLPSSSSSSDTDWRLEKPSGKRKYKTRHLERARRQSVRERERSPSVEIIYERQATDRSGRKKRSRKRAREQNSPTIITISSSGDETQNTEARYQRPLTEDEDTDSKNRTVREKGSAAEIKHPENGRDSFTEFIDFLTDYADRNSRCSGSTLGYQDQNRPETEHDLSDCLTQGPDGSPNMDEIRNHAVFKDKDASNSTDCCRGQPGEHTDRVSGVTHPSASSKHRSPDANAESPDDQKPNEDPTAPEARLCGHGADDFLDQHGTDRSHPEACVSMDTVPTDQVLGTLNLEHCLIDVVEPDVRTQISPPSLLMDTQGQGQEPRTDGTPRDQKEAGLGAGSEHHRDPSEAETMSESQDDAGMSSDV